MHAKNKFDLSVFNASWFEGFRGTFESYFKTSDCWSPNLLACFHLVGKFLFFFGDFPSETVVFHWRVNTMRYQQQNLAIAKKTFSDIIQKFIQYLGKKRKIKPIFYIHHNQDSPEPCVLEFVQKLFSRN